MDGCFLGSTTGSKGFGLKKIGKQIGENPNWQNIPAFRCSLFTSSCFLKHWKSPKMKGSGSTNVLGSWPLGCNLIGHDPSISQSVNQSFNQLIHPSINRSISQGWTVIFHQAELWWVSLAPFPWWSPKTWRWRQLDVELRGKKAPLLIWLGNFQPVGPETLIEKVMMSTSSEKNKKVENN